MTTTSNSYTISYFPKIITGKVIDRNNGKMNNHLNSTKSICTDKIDYCLNESLKSI